MSNKQKFVLVGAILLLSFAVPLLGIGIPTTSAEASTDHLNHKKDISVGDLTGTWSFNGNGSTGWMTIWFNNQGALTVAVTFNGLARKDNWTISWDNQAKSITLIRDLPNNVRQVHTGFLGDNEPAHLILAGSFTESDIPSNAARTQFGWFAEWKYGIIV